MIEAQSTRPTLIRERLKGYGERIVTLLNKRDERISKSRDLTHILSSYYDKINPEPLLDPEQLFRNGYVQIVVHNDFWPADPQKDIKGETWDYFALLLPSYELTEAFESVIPGEHTEYLIRPLLINQGYFCENVETDWKRWSQRNESRNLQMDLFLSKKLDQFNLTIRWPNSPSSDAIATIRAVG